MTLGFYKFPLSEHILFATINQKQQITVSFQYMEGNLLTPRSEPVDLMGFLTGDKQSMFHCEDAMSWFH